MAPRPEPTEHKGAIAAAVGLSLLVHGAILAWTHQAAPREAPLAAPTAPASAPSVVDLWSGESPAPGAVEPRPAEGPQAPGVAAPIEVEPPATKPAAEPSHVDAPSAPEGDAPARPRRPPPPTPHADGAVPQAHASAAPERGGRGGSGGGARGGGPFGAEGAPSVRSLGRAFLRAIPAACSDDAAWSLARLGDVGTIDIALALDEHGKLQRGAGDELFRSLTPGARPELLGLARRTTLQLEYGTFAIRAGEVAQGTEMLRLSVRVSAVEVPPDLEGGVFGLEHDYDKGTAGFTQRSGRHVEVHVDVVGTELP